MTRPFSSLDFDPRIADWLERDPDDAPPAVLDTVLAAFPSIPQRHRSRVPWRYPMMNRILVVAATAAAIGVVGLASLALVLRPGPGPGTGASPASARPTATAPTAPQPSVATPAPVVPASLLPSPAGDALPGDLIGRTYAAKPAEVIGTQQLVLTLRPADDPHCAAMFGGRSTCFTVLWTPNYPAHQDDPGARGSARIVGGRLVLSFDIVPFDAPCVGQKATYAIADGGATLTGINPPSCTFQGFTAR